MKQNFLEVFPNSVTSFGRDILQYSYLNYINYSVNSIYGGTEPLQTSHNYGHQLLCEGLHGHRGRGSYGLSDGHVHERRRDARPRLWPHQAVHAIRAEARLQPHAQHEQRLRNFRVLLFRLRVPAREAPMQGRRHQLFRQRHVHLHDSGSRGRRLARFAHVRNRRRPVRYGDVQDSNKIYEPLNRRNHTLNPYPMRMKEGVTRSGCSNLIVFPSEAAQLKARRTIANPIVNWAFPFSYQYSMRAHSRSLPYSNSRILIQMQMQQGLAQGEKLVYLVQVPTAKVFTFERYSIEPDRSLASLRNSLSYRLPQTFLTPGTKLCLPCVPAYSLREVKQAQKARLFDGKGFIKAVPLPDQTQLQVLVGRQSGKRSAVVEWKGKLYRLKGCGNLNEGFPSREMVSEVSGLVEIRGCMFEQTVRRELYITDQVNHILESYKLKGANQSAGYWEYASVQNINQHLSEPLQNSFQIVPKYCGIYETLGDQRLGTHLLQGLRVIIARLLQSWTFDAVLKLITHPERIIKRPDGSLDLVNTQFRERDLSLEDCAKGSLKEALQQDQVFDWQKEAKNINLTTQLEEHDALQLISRLYERVGYEVGKIKRIFIDHDLSWGYFRDHSRFQYHCNAHLDNFVVTLEDPTQILAPLDFDLAFFKDEYISIDLDLHYEQTDQQILDIVREAKEKDNIPQLNQRHLKYTEREALNYGKFDAAQWEWHMEQERVSIELAISGVDIIMQSSMFVEEDKKNVVQEFFEIMLRDQMRIGYLNGFHYKPDSSGFQEKRDEFVPIIREALGHTQHIIA